MAVTRSEFDEWKQHPVTKKLMDQIRKDVEQMKELLIFVEPENLQGLQGRCAASTNLLLVDYGDLFDAI